MAGSLVDIEYESLYGEKLDPIDEVLDRVLEFDARAPCPAFNPFHLSFSATI